MHSCPRHPSKAVVFIFVLMVFSILWPAPSAAVSLDCSIGFNGRFQLNKWTPLTVRLENSGRATSGTLEVMVTSGNEYDRNVFPTIYAADVELPTNSKKRYAFTVLIHSVTHDLMIRLRQNDSILISKSIDLRPYYTEKRLILVADDFVSPDILAVMPKEIHPVNLTPQYLPETWYGYDSVTLLILKAGMIGALSQKQFRALTQWIKQGGYLLTSGGLNYGALSHQRMQQILPVSVSGHKQVFALNALADFCGRALTGHGPFLVINARIDDSRVLVNENEIPIIFQKKLGLGQIIFLSFDYSTPLFRNWDGRGLFWSKILAMRPSAGNDRIDLDDQEILDAMSAKIPARFQSLKSAFIFVGAYVAFLTYFLKRLKKPGKPRWQYSLFIFFTIIVFSAVGYWRFLHPNRAQRFTYNSFGQLEMSGRNIPASLGYFIGIYALKESTHVLGLGSLSCPLSHILSKRSNKKIPNPYVIHESDAGQQIVGSLDRWSHSFYKVNSKLAAPLKGSAGRDNRILTVTVENTLPHNIVDCLVYFKKRFLGVDEILAGSQQVIQLELSNLKRTEVFNERELQRIVERYDAKGPSYLKIAQKNLTETVLRDVHAKYRFKPHTLVLIGWTPAGVIRPQFEQHLVRGENLTLIKWELPVEMTS